MKVAENVPTNKALYGKIKAEAKRKFDVFPSAYASGWMVQEYKRRGGQYKKASAEPKGPLNKPMRDSSGNKKFKVYVRDPQTGNVKTVRFGDPNMEIKRDDPERRRNFRARHNCDDPGPKTKARYWSCYQWRGGAKVED